MLNWNNLLTQLNNFAKNVRKIQNANAKNVDALSVVVKMILRNNYFVKSANTVSNFIVGQNHQYADLKSNHNHLEI